MFNIVNIGRPNGNFSDGLCAYKKFIRNNVHRISMVNMHYSVFIEDICKSMGFHEDQEIRDFGNKIFCNRYFRGKAPIVSVEFVDEVSNEMIANDHVDSLMSYLSFYNVPVFIRGLDIVNDYFSNIICDNYVLLSSELDKKFYDYLIASLDNRFQINSYLLPGYDISEVGLTKIQINNDINTHDAIKVKYEDLLGEFYGKGKK